MPVEADKAIIFKCEYCKNVQFYRYTLEHGWMDDRYVMRDQFKCKYCGRDNEVYQEL